jgi:hypothetical protein
VLLLAACLLLQLLSRIRCINLIQLRQQHIIIATQD